MQCAVRHLRRRVCHANASGPGCSTCATRVSWACRHGEHLYAPACFQHSRARIIKTTNILNREAHLSTRGDHKQQDARHHPWRRYMHDASADLVHRGCLGSGLPSRSERRDGGGGSSYLIPCSLRAAAWCVCFTHKPADLRIGRKLLSRATRPESRLQPNTASFSLTLNGPTTTRQMVVLHGNQRCRSPLRMWDVG